MHRRERCAFLARMANADAPRRAVGLRPDRPHVAAEIDEPVRDPVLGSRSSPRDRPRIPCRCRRSRSPSRRAAGGSSARPIRLRAQPTSASAASSARASGTRGGPRRKSQTWRRTPGGEVEKPVAQRETAIGIRKQRRGLGVDRDRRAAGGAIDPRRIAVVAVARVLGFDAATSAIAAAATSRATRLGRREQLQLVVRRHRAEHRADERHRHARSARRRSERFGDAGARSTAPKRERARRTATAKAPARFAAGSSRRARRRSSHRPSAFATSTADVNAPNADSRVSAVNGWPKTKPVPGGGP